jgi:S1-C subfamily serine protease
VAILQLEKITSLMPAQLSQVEINVGDYALAIGHPIELKSSLTIGIVSHLHRFENVGSGDKQRWLADLIQFDASANPGNSGGPLFNKDGQLIELNRSMAREYPLRCQLRASGILPIQL